MKTPLRLFFNWTWWFEKYKRNINRHCAIEKRVASSRHSQRKTVLLKSVQEWRSFIKRQTSGTSSDNEWHRMMSFVVTRFVVTLVNFCCYHCGAILRQFRRLAQATRTLLQLCQLNFIDLWKTYLEVYYLLIGDTSQVSAFFLT